MVKKKRGAPFKGAPPLGPVRLFLFGGSDFHNLPAAIIPAALASMVCFERLPALRAGAHRRSGKSPQPLGLPLMRPRMGHSPLWNCQCHPLPSLILRNAWQNILERLQPGIRDVLRTSTGAQAQVCAACRAQTRAVVPAENSLGERHH